MRFAHHIKEGLSLTNCNKGIIGLYFLCGFAGTEVALPVFRVFIIIMEYQMVRWVNQNLVYSAVVLSQLLHNDFVSFVKL